MKLKPYEEAYVYTPYHVVLKISKRDKKSIVADYSRIAKTCNGYYGGSFEDELSFYFKTGNIGKFLKDIQLLKWAVGISVGENHIEEYDADVTSAFLEPCKKKPKKVK